MKIDESFEYPQGLDRLFQDDGILADLETFVI